MATLSWKSTWERLSPPKQYIMSQWMSFLNQSQQTFVIFLQILSCIFVLNLSKIRLFMFPWQHILENYVTVTLFLNQYLETFELFLEMISGTSVQNFRRKKCFILPWQHILLRVLRQNRVIEIIDDLTVASFCCQSQQNFVFLFVIPRSIFVQNLSKIGQETKKLHKGECDIVSKNSSIFFVFE